VLTLLQERNLLKARGTQRTDSTHSLAAIRTLNRLELVGETMRYALHRLAVVDPAWLRVHMQPEWAERYGIRVENYRFPKANTESQKLATVIGADGFTLLLASYAPDAPLKVHSALAVEVLRHIRVQQYYGPEPVPRWRQDGDVPPPVQLIHYSPYDLEARYSLKRGMTWVGYKEHMGDTHCDMSTRQTEYQMASGPRLDRSGGDPNPLCAKGLSGLCGAVRLYPSENPAPYPARVAPALPRSPPDHV
jgi:transposase